MWTYGQGWCEMVIIWSYSNSYFLRLANCKMWSHHNIVNYILFSYCIRWGMYTLFHLAHEGIMAATSLAIPVKPVVSLDIHAGTIFIIIIIISIGIRLTQIPFLILKWASIGPVEPVICVRKRRRIIHRPFIRILFLDAISFSSTCRSLQAGVPEDKIYW